MKHTRILKSLRKKAFMEDRQLHTVDELIEALSWLSPEQQKIVAGYSLTDVLKITNKTDEEFKQYTDLIEKTKNQLDIFVGALTEIRQYYDDPVSEPDKVVTAYKDMNVMERQQTAEKLMKNMQFNNWCCAMMGMAVNKLKDMAEPEKDEKMSLPDVYDRGKQQNTTGYSMNAYIPSFWRE